MKIKRKFFSGVYKLSELTGVETLELSKVITAAGVRGFNVTAIPNGKIVYWSFSRRKANRFIQNKIAKSSLERSFNNSIKLQSLDYDYRYTPNEYLAGLTISSALLANGLFNSLDTEVNPSLSFTTLFSLVAITNLAYFLKSKAKAKEIKSISENSGYPSDQSTDFL